MRLRSQSTRQYYFEAVDALVTDPDGFYIDGTFGRGGATAELLSELSEKVGCWRLTRIPRPLQRASKGLPAR